MAPDAPQSATPPIGILSAFRMEVSALARGLTSPGKILIGGKRAWRGRLGHLGVIVLPGGMGGEKTSASSRALLDRGVSAILCVGSAGALDDRLQVGDIVIAEWVVSAGDPASRKSCDPGMADRAKRLAGERGFGTFAGGLAGAAQPATTPGEKARLWTATGALAVDLESAAAAAAAEAAGGVPFLAVRVITDDSRTALPDFRSGWKKPARLLKDGAGFVGRIAAMRRALRAHQEFLRLFLSRFPPPSDDPSHVGRSPGGQADRRS
ncbi:MAG: hypothetical protein QGF68_03660 [Nitrospinota bacterium]|nr:hypothetical protein [Nitrospinota bacterium]HJM41883.1 hypothetical protein [Nitrospinota bacterium]